MDEHEAALHRGGPRRSHRRTCELAGADSRRFRSGWSSFTAPRATSSTDGGREVAAARRALADVDAVGAVAARHRDDESGTLLIGFEATGAGDLGTAARQRFADLHPGVRTEPRRFEWGGETEALRGSVDVAFVWLPCDDRDLHLEVIATEPRFAGVSTRHPLADRAELSIDELRGRDRARQPPNRRSPRRTTRPPRGRRCGVP